MRLTNALTREFGSSTRHKGEAYVIGHRVVLLSSDAWQVEALVRGTRPYHVTLTREDEDDQTTVAVACSCPYYGQFEHPCKHIWASLRIAESGPFLTGRGGPLSEAQTHLELRPPVPAPTEGMDAAAAEIQKTSALAAVPGRLPNTFLQTLRTQFAIHERAAAPTYRFAGAELLFVIDGVASLVGDGLVLDLLSRRRTETGAWTKPAAVPITSEDLATAPGWDRRVLAPLLGATRIEAIAPVPLDPDAAPRPSRFRLSHALLLELLPAIARSGRAYLRSGDRPGELHPVGWDDNAAWVFRLEVTRGETGFKLAGRFQRGDQNLPLTAPVLITSAGFLVTRQHIARWDASSVPVSIVRALRTAGVVHVDDVDRALLARTLADSGVPIEDVPEELRIVTVDVPPKPHLRVGGVGRWHRTDRLVADLSFDYGGHLVAWEPVTPATGPLAPIFDEPGLRLIRRQPEDEARWERQLPAVGFVATHEPEGRQPRFELRARQLNDAVHTLVADGWHVEGEGYAYRPAGRLRISVTSGIDWFDLDAKVEFGDTTVPLTDLLGALKRGDPAVRLGDGTMGLLPDDWLRRYLPLVLAGEVKDGRIRFTRPQAALLDALLRDRADEASISVDAGFERVRRELLTFSQVAPADPSPAFIGTLRPYQREGLGWLHFLRRFGFGGCLADDMGLGKTVMVLALLDSLRASRVEAGVPTLPSLIVVPRSLIHNWMSEASRFAPELRVLDYSHATRAESRDAVAAHDIVLVTYGTLRRDVAALGDIEFEYVILDEAQAIKNAATASSKAARLLNSRHRLALSGTPIENHLGELWSLFEFLNPGILGASSAFQRATSAANPTIDRETTNLLSAALRPFILRRTKEQVAGDLPARMEQTLLCDLPPKERALYDTMRRHYRGELLDRVAKDGLSQSRMHILEALLRLRQASCHPGLIDPKRRGDMSAKFEVLLPRLREVVAEGHKALVFSQFTSLLALLRPKLEEEKLTYEYLDGRVRDRAARVDRFQTDPACGLFLISLKAGGLGLNLTAAEYVFLLDPWWNPAAEAQAIDRAHRIGQTREVFAYRLIARDTVEEKVLALQHSKRALADAVLSADAVGLRHLRREDLELLLQ